MGEQQPEPLALLSSQAKGTMIANIYGALTECEGLFLTLDLLSLSESW